MAEEDNYEGDGYDGWEEEEEDQEKMLDEGRAQRERERSPARNAGRGATLAPNPAFSRATDNLANPDRRRLAQLRLDFLDDELCGHNGHHPHTTITHTNGACFKQRWWRHGHGRGGHNAPRENREQAVMPRPRTEVAPPAPLPSQPPPQPAGQTFHSSGHMFFMNDPSAMAGIINAFQK